MIDFFDRFVPVSPLTIQGCRSGGGAWLPPDFDRSVNPISTREEEIMPITLLLAPLGFSDLLMALELQKKKINVCQAKK